jgi:hypothetical protein
MKGGIGGRAVFHSQGGLSFFFFRIYHQIYHQTNRGKFSLLQLETVPIDGRKTYVD